MGQPRPERSGLTPTPTPDPGASDGAAGTDGTPATESPAAENKVDDRIEPHVLALLVCPSTRGPLIYDRAARELVSRLARLAYPIVNGVPILSPSEARILDDDDPRLRRPTRAK